MSGWSATLYAQFPDEATARAMAEQLGADFPPDGSIPTGNANYVLVAPIVEWLLPPVLAEDGSVIDAGERRAGYWAMLRLNMDWPGYGEALATLQAAGVLRELDAPGNVFA